MGGSGHGSGTNLWFTGSSIAVFVIGERCRWRNFNKPNKINPETHHRIMKYSSVIGSSLG
jgi:hypothetical protein